jgi:hypothetical protein
LAHSRFAINEEMYELLGVSLMIALERRLHTRLTVAAHRAWLTAYCSIAERVIREAHGSGPSAEALAARIVPQLQPIVRKAVREPASQHGSHVGSTTNAKVAQTWA